MPSIRSMPLWRRARSHLLAAALLALASPALHAQPHEPDFLPVPEAPPAHFGALAFTADGSFSAVWKRGSKAEAEGQVLADCAKFHRGKCQVVSFREELCAAIASFHTTNDVKVTYAGGGVTRADAQRSALDRCNGDERARSTCQIRTVVCGDGR
jgi:hypothetical protein